jgi:GMP synthase-like glutamine amidotransferase
VIPKIWFIKNMTHEGAGLFSSFAEKAGIAYASADLHQGDPFPKISQGQAVVILGGPDSANDKTSKVLNELEAIRACLGQGIPCLGVCLGLQLLVKAAHGAVLKSPVKEIGFRDPSGEWFELEKTAEGMKDPFLEGISDRSKVFQLHGETVKLNSSMKLLARSRFCENQIVRIQEGAYGIQGHVELSERMFEDWLAADGDLREMNVTELRRDFLEVRRELEQSSEMLFRNFIRISGILR